VAVF